MLNNERLCFPYSSSVSNLVVCRERFKVCNCFVDYFTGCEEEFCSISLSTKGFTNTEHYNTDAVCAVCGDIAFLGSI